MTSHTAQLAELTTQIRRQTLCTALLHTAGALGAQPAYSDKLGKGATTRTWTWERFRNDVLDLAAGLLDHGVARGARVAIMLSNRVEHVVADAAAVFLADSEIIDSAMVHGDGRPHLVALVTLDRHAATRIARGAGIPDGDRAQPAGEPEILAAVQRAVAAANARVSRPEQVKKFVVLDEQWSTESGELTPTLKLRRAVVTARHAEKLDRLYERKAANCTSDGVTDE